MWLTRYWQNPLKSECADKYRVREYIKGCGLGDILIPVYGVWQNAEEIDFDTLPSQFVLKCNHGCGYNIICKNCYQFDKAWAIDRLNRWLKEDYGAKFYEKHYSAIRPLVYCEQYLPSLEQSVIDYKIHCFNGKPYCFFVCTDREADNHRVTFSFYSLNWERLNLLKIEPDKMVERPHNLVEMIEVATVLSKPFPYVRVDLYEIDEKLYFGEMTFTPRGNVMDYYKDEVLIEMGNLLQLPPKF